MPIFGIRGKKMQISNSGVQSNAAEWVRKAHSEESVHTKKENAQKTGKTAADYVSISANAGNSSEALVKARANALPEIREERVASSKERIEDGYYNTKEFNKELAERLIEG
jgi:anti-sigma28 factor (negative regulator of flagellin synthesis)